MKTKIPLRAAVAAVISFAVIVSVLTVGAMNSALGGFDFKIAAKLGEISRLAESQYYYDIDNDAVTNAVLSGYVNGLSDDYAAYYDKDAAKKQVASIKGDSYGIGIIAVSTADESGIYAWKVYEKSPAENAGLKPGDIITEIDGKTVESIGFSDAANMFYGSIGKKVKLRVKRGKKTFSVVVTCGECDAQTVYIDSCKKGEPAVVQVTGFNDKTAVQFEGTVNECVKKGASSLIIDLRHNGGGTVSAAAKMLDFLLPEGDTVHVMYKDRKIFVRNRSDASCINLPFAVLCDGGTASASEIFASTLRELGGAKLIGSTTYGKSVIQRSYTLKDGSRVKFTVGEFVPSNGESYNKKGLKPDISVDPKLQSDYDFYFLTSENDVVKKYAVNYMKKNCRQ